jgi:hypothetical protein
MGTEHSDELANELPKEEKETLLNELNTLEPREFDQRLRDHAIPVSHSSAQSY